MCLVKVSVDDAVAGADPVRLTVQPGEAGTAEHVEDLLRVAVHVWRRRHFAGGELDAVCAGAPAASGRAERGPRAGHLAAVPTTLFDLVPVRDSHARDSMSRLRRGPHRSVLALSWHVRLLPLGPRFPPPGRARAARRGER